MIVHLTPEDILYLTNMLKMSTDLSRKRDFLLGKLKRARLK